MSHDNIYHFIINNGLIHIWNNIVNLKELYVKSKLYQSQYQISIIHKSAKQSFVNCKLMTEISFLDIFLPPALAEEVTLSVLSDCLSVCVCLWVLPWLNHLNYDAQAFSFDYRYVFALISESMESRCYMFNSKFL